MALHRGVGESRKRGEERRLGEWRCESSGDDDNGIMYGVCARGRRDVVVVDTIRIWTTIV